MGCCVSTPKPLQRDQNYPDGPSHHPSPETPSMPESGKTHVRDSLCNRAPPPVEEETVKEVLSETPIPKPHNPIMAVEETHTQKMPVLGEEKIETQGLVYKPDEISQVSQASDMSSVTGSFSTATTITEKKEDEATSREDREMGKRVKRSPAKVHRKRPYSGEISGGREIRPKSPARKPEPSPEKRTPVGARPGRGRGRKLNVPGPAAVRRDSVHGSGRRSRSPATRAAGGSPMKVSGRAGESSREVGVEVGAKKEEPNDGVLQQGNESVENPLVSLECFIFL